MHNFNISASSETTAVAGYGDNPLAVIILIGLLAVFLACSNGPKNDGP